MTFCSYKIFEYATSKATGDTQHKHYKKSDGHAKVLTSISK